MRRVSKEEALGLGMGDEIEGRKSDDEAGEGDGDEGGVGNGDRNGGKGEGDDGHSGMARKGKGSKARRVVGGDVMREEFYRLQAKDLEDWENRRVERLPGEHDGRL